MNDRQLRLETLRTDILQRLDLYQEHHRRLNDPLEQDFAEQAVQRQNDQVVEGLEEEARTTLHQIERALSRLRHGKGDVCERCGEPIPLARLAARPETTLCINCAS